MADPRTNLPVGQWKISGTRVRLPRHKLEPPTFWILATDDATGDRVQAFVSIGKLSGDYSLEDCGIPGDVPWGRVLHLARIEPRKELARGGTIAVIEYLREPGGIKTRLALRINGSAPPINASRPRRTTERAGAAGAPAATRWAWSSRCSS